MKRPTPKPEISARLRYAITMLLVLLLTACFGKGKIAEKEGEVPADITRPPELVLGTKEQQVESNPDETVSFGEWRKQQTESEAKKTAEDASTQYRLN